MRALVLVALAACGGDKVDKMRDAMCACTTWACTRQVFDENRDLLLHASPDRAEVKETLRCASRVGEDLAGVALRRMAALRDEMCACKDEACAVRVDQKLTENIDTTAFAGSGRALDDAASEYGACWSKFRGAAGSAGR